MENSKKKDLAKIALAAFMLSASLPAAGNANFDAESQGTLLAGGGCGDHTNKSSATSSCSATPGRISPASSSYNASSDNVPASSSSHEEAKNKQRPGEKTKEGALGEDTVAADEPYRRANARQPEGTMGGSSSQNQESSSYNRGSEEYKDQQQKR